MVLSVRKRILLVLVLLVGYPLGCGQRVCARPPQEQNGAKLLVNRATGPTPMMDDLEELCDRIGGRPTGSKACERAVDWAVAKFRAAGVDSVWAETYTIPWSWRPIAAEAECVTPEHIPLRLAACPFTASTPGSLALEAPLIDAGTGTPEDFARLGEKARGAIVLVHSDELKTEEDLFKEYKRDKPMLEAARRASVAALLLQSTRPRGLLYRHPLDLAAISPIPAAIISREEGGRLARLAEKSEVRLRLRLKNEITGPIKARNVVAEIRGHEAADDIVLLSAHLDSWDLGTGADDNGVNAALVIDVARGIKQLGLIPSRTIRFALFTGEEQGMLGSEAYTRQHANEMERHIVTVTFDTGSGKTTGFYLNGRAELRKPLRDTLAAGGLDVTDDTTAAINGTDNFDFLLSGVPNLVAVQEWAPYLPNYHAESDVFDWVNKSEAKNNAAIAAVLVWGFAQNAERPAPHQTRAQVEELLRNTRLDEQMKTLGQWDDWTAGKRGMSK